MMKVLNVEIKARCHDHERIRRLLADQQAAFIGKDHQVDTYYSSGSGRLKLREGNIENKLIWYSRPDELGPKTSQCLLYKTGKETILKDILEGALGVMTVVDKEREIYFLDNVKIHLDVVKDLGTFLEIEAQGKVGNLSEADLYRQCTRLMGSFGISPADLVRDSYSDLLMRKQHEDHKRGTNRG